MASVQVYTIPGTPYAIVVITDSQSIAANNNTATYTLAPLPKSMRNAAFASCISLDNFAAADGLISFGLPSGNPLTITIATTFQVQRELAPASARVVAFAVVMIGEFVL